MVDTLAMNRNLAAIAELAPGITDNGPNTGQIAIAGAFAYDNVFLLNGVDINDNLFGTANNLFIEDAIEEVQVLTSRHLRGIRPLLGRRHQRGHQERRQHVLRQLPHRLHEPELARREPVREGGHRGQPARHPPHRDDTTLLHTATLGGPVLKDRLWFFGADAPRDVSVERASLTGVPATTTQLDNRRYEGKLTGAIAANHNLQADYIRNTTAEFNRASINTTLSIDAATLVDRTSPTDLFVANYNGVLAPNLFVEAQYSQKKFGFRSTGGTSHDHHRFAVPGPGPHGGIPIRATTTRPTSARSTRRTATTGSTPPRCRISCPRPAPAATT